MPKETKFFTGGMDTDSEDRLLPRDRYRHAFMLNFNQRDGKAGVGYKENGNVLVPYTLPAGDNECIGSREHIANGSIIYFVHNSLGNHGIYEFFPETNTIEPILINDILNFSLDRRIHSINVFDDNLAWCDDLAPKHLIISSAKAHTAGTGSTADVFAYDSLLATGTQEQKAQFITAGAYPPLNPPTLDYSTDLSIIDFINGKLYQSAYRYVYFDNTRSTFSPISKLSEPTNDEKGLEVFGSLINNVLEITYNTGHSTVKSIEIAVREGNFGTFYLVDVIDKYDEVNGSIINDYSDQIYKWSGSRITAIPDSELINNYAIPVTAKAQTLSYNNVLFYGNYVYGYDRVVLDVEPNVTSTVISGEDIFGDRNNLLLGTDTFVNILDTVVLSTNQNYIDENYPITISLANEDTAQEYIYVFNSYPPTGYTLIQLADAILVDINIFLNSVGLNDWGRSTDGSFIGQYFNNFGDPNKGSSLVGEAYQDTTINSKYKTLKSGSEPDLGIVYFDSLGRHNGVSKIDSVQIPLYSNNSIGNTLLNYDYSPVVHKLDLTINNLAPDWATSYQIVRKQSEISYHVVTKSDAVVENFDFNGRNAWQLPNCTLFDNVINYDGVDYEFQKGDRVRFIAENFLGAPKTFTLYVDVKILTVDVAGKYIVIEVPSAIDRSTFVYFQGELMFEIYRPNINDTEIYYEIGEQRAVVNGLHQATTNQTATTPANLELDYGDAYINLLPDLLTGVTGVETMFYSKHYQSTYSDQGRFHFFSNTIRQVNLSNHFIYGGRYFEDTQTNRLFEFSANNDNVVSSEYGEIRKLVSVQYTVKVLQDKRISSAYLNRQVAVNPGGSDSVVLSDKFVAEIRPYPMEMGTQHPESVVLQNRYLYMWDARNGFAIRDDANGPDSISKHNFMTGSRRLSGEYNNKRIFGSYDESNDRVLWTFGDTTKSETVVFEPTTQLWRGFTHYHPEQYISIGMVFISFKNGNLWVHNDEFNQGMLYGDSYDAIIETVFNENPKNIKTGLSIAVHSNKPWAAPNKGDISTEDTNMYGTQETRILANRFEYQDRVFYADIPRDMNTPNVVAPIINGDKLQGAIFKVRLTNGDLGEVKIFAIDLNYLNNTEI